MTQEEKEEIFTAIDDFASKLRATLDAGNVVAKSLVRVWLESLEKESTAQRQTARDRYPSLVTIKQLAEIWGVSERAIRTWMAKDGLLSRRLGADVRFDLAEVDEWTKRHRKINRTSTAANGKVTPLQTRLQAR